MITSMETYANPANKMGKLIMVDINMLFIPALDEKGCRLVKSKKFQRDKVSDKKIKDMSSRWDWILCGALIVCNIEKVLYVVDGGNRLRAARLHGKIAKMPCIVFDNITVEEAAKAFIGIQKIRTAVSSSQNHVTSLIWGSEIAKKADNIVKAKGYEISASKSGNFIFDAVNSLYDILCINYDATERAFAACAEIAGGERIFKELLFGAFELELRSAKQHARPFFDKQSIEKLKSFGPRRIMGEVNSVRSISGNSGGSQSKKVPARAILNLINKGKRGGAKSISLDD